MSSYAPLSPDWLLPLGRFAACAVYPLVGARIYRGQIRSEHLLEHWTERPFRRSTSRWAS